MNKQKEAFYKSSLKGDAVTALLTYDPDTDGGSNLLPADLSRDLVAEPVLENPIRQAGVFTAIKNLVLPRIVIDFDQFPVIDDLTTALEIEAAGDQAVFERFKTKIKVVVSDSVAHGSDAGLAIFIENQLRAALGRLELARILDPAPAIEIAHMSLLAADLGETVTLPGAAVLGAIKAAIKDLPKVFKPAALVLINSDLYGTLQDDLCAVHGGGIYSAAPVQLFTRPALFCDAVPDDVIVVGDFRHLRFNYNGLTFDSKYMAEDGNYHYVLTCWYDCHIMIKNAFRRVKVQAV